MKKIYKLIVLALAVALICTGLVFAVSAESAGTPGAIYTDSNGAEQTAATLDVAFANAKAETTIQLTGDTQVTAQINVTKNLTLDLNGYDLSCNQSSAFKLNAAGLIFTLTGEGSLTLQGAIYSGTADGVVNIIGTGSGIDALHTGELSEKFINVNNGTFNVKNLRLVSTLATHTKGNALFNDYSSSANGDVGAEWYIDNVECYSDNSGDASGASTFNGLRFLSVGSNGYAKITNTTVNNTACIIGISGTGYKAADETIIDVENCIFNAFSGPNGTRSSIFAGTMSADTSARGTINVKDSVLTYAYNLVMHANASATEEIANNVTVNLINSTAKGIGHIAKESDQGGMVTNNVIVNVDSDSSVTYIDNLYSNDAKIYAAEGARFSGPVSALLQAAVFFPDSKSATAEDTEYAFIYDPVGNPSAPYVTAKKAEKSDAVFADFFNFENSNVVLTDSAVAGSYIAQYAVGGNVTESVASIKANVAKYDATSTNRRGSNIPLHGEGEFYNFNGALAEYIKGGNTALKYWLPVLDSTKQTLGATYAIGSSPNLGMYERDRTVSKNRFGNNAAKVAVFEADIATDSEYGFAAGSIKIGTRNASNSAKVATSLSIANNGILDITPLTDRPSDAVQLKMDGWNRVTFVCYVDVAVSAKGRMYVYLDGECLGYANISSEAAASNDALAYYMQGFRMDVSSTQVIGSSILFDNISSRAFADYCSGESAENLTPDYYVENYSLAYNEDFTRNLITVHGKPFATVNEAIEYGQTVGVYPKLNGDIVLPQLVNVNGSLIVDGYKLELKEGSYPFDSKKDSDGNNILYIFDNTLNAEIVFKWYLGELGNEAQLADPAFWKTETLTYGDDVNIQGAIKYIVDEANSKFNVNNGWDTDGDGKNPLDVVISKEFVSSLEGNLNVTLYPTYSEDKPLTLLIKDNSSGAYLYCSDTDVLDSSVWSNFTANTTFVLYDDFTTNIGFGRSAKTAGATYNFDFNGHTICNPSKSGGFFGVANGATLNIYSSVPGAMYYNVEINDNESATNKNFGGGVFIQLKDDGTESLATAQSKTDATTLNLGTVTVGGNTYSGSNLTLAGDCLVEPRLGGANAEINIDGVTMHRPGSDYGAMILSRYYYGTINVTNSNFIVTSPAASVIGNNSQGNGATPTAIIDNCVFIFKNNTKDNSVLNGGAGFGSITFTNCVSNGCFNPSNAAADVLKFGEGNLSSYITAGNDYLADGIKKVYANIPMQMPDFSFSESNEYLSSDENGVLKIKLWKYASSNANGKPGAADNGYLYIVPNGYNGEIGATDADTVIELPVLSHKTTANTVNVTFNGLGTNASQTFTYAVGGNVVEGQVFVKEYLGAALKFVADGKFVEDELATNLVAGETYVYTPTCKAEANIKGLKANLSLYSDFMVNLYIPASYVPYITGVNGVEISSDTVILSGAEYVRVAVSKVAKMASEDAVFEIALAEDGYTASSTVSISIVDYASAILGGEYTDADKTLMYYMLNYVNEAVEYFANSADATEIKTLLENNAENYGKEDISHEYANANEDTGLGDFFSAAGVVLEDAPAFVLIPKGNFTGTVTVTYGDGNVRNFNVTEGSVAALKIEGMKIYNFSADIAVTVADANGAVLATGALNLDTYAKYHTDNAVDESSETWLESYEALELIQALYDYVKVAEAYKAGTLANPEVNE